MAIKIVSTATYISCQPEQDEVKAVYLFLKEVLLILSKGMWGKRHDSVSHLAPDSKRSTSVFVLPQPFRCAEELASKCTLSMMDRGR